MQRAKSFPAKIRGQEDSTRRTTVILDREEREFIDQLIREGKEPGIKQLISKMLNVYRSMMIYDWHFPGEYYCGISRIAFVNVELLNILIQQTPREKWREIGRQMGAALKVSMETTLDITSVSRDNWDSVFQRLKVQGFGEFYTKDRYLLAKIPFISEADILAGILEGLLQVQLYLKNSVPPLIFEVRKPLDTSATKQA
jgi:hypothetical protein